VIQNLTENTSAGFLLEVGVQISRFRLNMLPLEVMHLTMADLLVLVAVCGSREKPPRWKMYLFCSILVMNTTMLVIDVYFPLAGFKATIE
jgi:hypothetical protein